MEFIRDVAVLIVFTMLMVAAGSQIAENFGPTPLACEGMCKLDRDFQKSVENDRMILEIRQKKADVLKTIGEAMKSPETKTDITSNVNSNVVNQGAQ